VTNCASEQHYQLRENERPTHTSVEVAGGTPFNRRGDVIENLGGEKAIRLACYFARRHVPFRDGTYAQKAHKKMKHQVFFNDLNQ